MNIALTKADLIRLVCGVDPSFDVFDIVLPFGDYNDYQSRWTWDRDKLNKLSEEELYQLYTEIKDK